MRQKAVVDPLPTHFGLSAQADESQIASEKVVSRDGIEPSTRRLRARGERPPVLIQSSLGNPQHSRPLCIA
jgi:hypothetical protein